MRFFLHRPSYQSFFWQKQQRNSKTYGIVAPGAGDRLADGSDEPGSGICRISGSSYFSKDGSCGFSPGFIVLTIRGVMTNTSSVSRFLNLVLRNRAPRIGISPSSGNLVRSLRIL